MAAIFLSKKISLIVEKALEDVNIPKAIADEIEGHIKDCETEMDDDSESIITNQRYNYIFLFSSP